MKKVLLSCLCLLGLASAAYAEDASPKVTLDFTTNEWGLPSNGGKAEKTYTKNGISISVYASTEYKFNNSGYMLFGKSGSYIKLPEFDFPVSKIEYVGNSGASTAVSMNVYVGDTAVSESTTGSDGTNVYSIDENYQAAGNIYKIKVDSKHNAQVTKILIYEAESAEPPTPAGTLGAVSVSPKSDLFEDEIEVYSGDKLTVSCENADYLLLGLPAMAAEVDEDASAIDQVLTDMGFVKYEGSSVSLTFDSDLYFTGAIGVKLGEGETLENIFLTSDFETSQIASFPPTPEDPEEEREDCLYIYSVIQPSAVEFSIADGTEVAKNTTLTLTCEKAQKICYTINNGAAVEVNGATATIKLTEDCTIAAYGVFGNLNSETVSASYTVAPPTYTMLVAKHSDKYYAMSATSNKISDYLGAVEVDVVDGKVQVAADANVDDLLWLVDLPSITSKSGQNLYYNSGTKLTLDDTKTTNWEEITTDGGLTYIGLSSSSRAILYNSSAPRFAAYASSNVGNTTYAIPESMPYEIAVPKLGEIKFSHDPGAYHTGHKVTISCKNATHLMIGVMKGDLSGMMLTDGEEDSAVPSVENIVVNGDSYSFTINHKEAPHVMIAGVRAFIMPGEYDEDTATDVKEYDPEDNEDLEDGLHVYSAIIPTTNTFCAAEYNEEGATPLINVDGSTTHSGNTSEDTSLVGRTYYGANVDLTFDYNKETSNNQYTYPTSYGNAVRIYNGDSFTVTPDPDYKITKVVIYTVAASKGGEVTATTNGANVGTIEGNGNGEGTITWTVETVKENNKPITFTMGSTVQFSHIEVTAVLGTTGIEGIEAEGNGAVEFYNLQGVRVENPTAGLYIMRQGSKAVKVLVK